MTDRARSVVLVFDLGLESAYAVGELLVFLFELGEGSRIVVLVLRGVGIGGHGLVRAGNDRVALNLRAREFIFFAASVAGCLDRFVQRLLAGRRRETCHALVKPLRMVSSLRGGVMQEVWRSYLLSHRQMCPAYVLVECHILHPYLPPHCPHMMREAKGGVVEDPVVWCLASSVWTMSLVSGFMIAS